MSEQLTTWSIIDGPSYEKFVIGSNLFAHARKMNSVLFTIETLGGTEKKIMSVNITGLTRHEESIHTGIFFFTAEYWDEGRGDEDSRMYLFGSYNPNTRKGYFHIRTKGELLKNELASLIFGFTMKQPKW
jgi:hypothetical protein